MYYRAERVASRNRVTDVRCGKRMSVVGFVTDAVATGRILEHLGLRTPEAEKPPPVREMVRVAEQGEDRGVPADWD